MSILEKHKAYIQLLADSDHMTKDLMYQALEEFGLNDMIGTAKVTPFLSVNATLSAAFAFADMLLGAGWDIDLNRQNGIWQASVLGPAMSNGRRPLSNVGGDQDPAIVLTAAAITGYCIAKDAQRKAM